MSGPVLLAFASGASGTCGALLLWRAARSRRRARPASLLAIARLLGRATGIEATPTGRDKAALAAAGVDDRLTPTDLQSVRLGAGTAGALLAVVLLGRPSGIGLPLAIVVGAICGASVPYRLLRRRARARTAAAVVELPAMLDLLRVAVEAGLPLRRALTEVAARSSGVVADELSLMAARLQRGETMTAAAASLKQRLSLAPVALLTGAIERSEREGVPPAPALEALAMQVRAARRVELQVRAARAVPRMQLVIATVLVPAVLALVAALVIGRLA